MKRYTSGPAYAQENPSQLAQSGKLIVDDYKNLEISVEEIKDNSTKLATQAVRTRVELRSRSVGLRPIAASTRPKPYLSVTVKIVGNAFNILIEFRRSASWPTPLGEGRGYVSAWDQSTLGSHGNSAAYILESLDEVLDLFLNEYLKANQDGK